MAINLLSLPKIKSIKHTIEPTWASDAGRNSNSGKFSGTFVGWFDNLEVEVGKTNQSEMTLIRNAIELPIFSVTFKDTRTGIYKTENFYGTAIGGATNNNNGMYESFSFSLKAISRRARKTD